MIAARGVRVQRPEAAAGESEDGVGAGGGRHAHVEVLVESLDSED